jgi:pimeloyl-ACP methyl ester carboxylesterase
MSQSQPVNEYQGQFVQANGTRLYYEEAGSGIPLLLLHGGMRTGRDWLPIMPILAQQYHVIALDSRGHGKSDNPECKLSYSLMAKDIAAFIKVLNLDRPLLIGFSDGGQICLELAMRTPGLCRALAIGGATYQFSENYYNALAELGIHRSGSVNIEHVTTNLSGVVNFLKNIHHPEDPDYWKEIFQEVAVLWTTPLNYSEEDFKKVVDPILIFGGDRDEFIGLEKEMLNLYRLIPGSELAIFPNSAHTETATKLISDSPYLHVVIDFFQRHSG